MTPIQRSLVFSSIERYSSVVLFFFATAALSRLLTPREFGVSAVVIAIATVVSASSQEFGGANYLIQKSTLTELNVRTAFTISCGLSLTLGALLWLSSGWLGAWFGVEGVGAGLKITAVSFAAAPICSTLMALLRRELHFGTIAIGNLVNNGVTASVSITLALLHFSYLAPIWGQFAGVAAQAIFLMASHNNLAIFRPSLSGYPDVLRFGLYSFGVSIINLIYNTAPQMLLARVLDFGAVGLYTRAVAISQLFDRLVFQAIGPVIMPAFVAQTRAGQDLKRVYLGALPLLTALHWPFLLLIAILAEPLIGLWLGPSWLPAAPLVQLYCIGALSLFAAFLTYPTLVAAGRIRDALLSSLVSLPPSLAVVFAASFFGVKAVAASALLTLPFQAAVAIGFVARRLHFSAGEFGAALSKSAVVALCSSMAAALGEQTIEHGVLGPLAGVFASMGLAGAAWLAALIAVDHPLMSALKDFAAGLRHSWGQRASKVLPVAGSRSNADC